LDSCNITICKNPEDYWCTLHYAHDCTAPTSSYKGGTHASVHDNTQEVDDCGDTWPGMTIINDGQQWRPALNGASGYLCRSVNLDHEGHQGYYLTSAEYDYYGICTDGGYNWNYTRTIDITWECHLGEVGTLTIHDNNITGLAVIPARHDIRNLIVTREALPTGPVAAVQIFGARVPSYYDANALAAASLVDPDAFNPNNQSQSAAFSDAVRSLLAQNVSSANNLTFTIRR
jgi:hypothetical protein